MIQNALTVIVPIKRAEVAALKELLSLIGDDIQRNEQLQWPNSPSTHFARFVILDPEASGGEDGQGVPSLKGYPPRLLFTSNYDGSFEEYMRELVRLFGASMEIILSKCEGYPPGASTDAARFTQFILKHSHLGRNAAPEAFYIACRGVTVQDVCESARIREALIKLLASRETQELLNNPTPLVPRSTSTLSVPQSGPSFKDALLARLGAYAAKLAERVIGIRSELNPNLPVYSPASQLAIEDRVTQNQMTVIVPVRPDWKARFLLPIVLGAVNKKASQSTGSLSGLTTIHFARWVIIDNGRNLLFESNYDGSWENYIDDFVDRASLGMNLISGNCTGFPRGGCKDIEWFKKYIRDNQIPAQAFYSAYRNSSIKNNLNDLQIAQAVKQILTQSELEQLLAGRYVLDNPTLKRLMSEPATALFLSGSYNRGVAMALQGPAPARAQQPSGSSPTTSPSPVKEAEIAASRFSDTGPAGTRATLGTETKKLWPVGLVAGIAVIAVWALRRKKD